MKSANRNNKPGHITRGDIFDDLGFSPAEALEAKIKAEIWQALIQHIEKHGFSQAYLVEVLNAHQPDVSNFLRGKISKFSITKLIQFAGRLNLDARVKVSSAKADRSISTLHASMGRTGKKKGELAHA